MSATALTKGERNIIKPSLGGRCFVEAEEGHGTDIAENLNKMDDRQGA